jgi:predicted dehydrogenase
MVDAAAGARIAGQPVSTAIVGAGRVAQHYRAILDSGAVSGWRIVGVCDVVADRARSLAGHFGCPAFTDYAAMLDQTDARLVLVLTPSGRHYEHARLVLERGRHVLVEKPLTMLPSDGRELARLATSQGLMCGVVFQNRLNPAIRCLREALEGGRFGRIVTAAVRLRWCRYQDYYEDGWHGTWALDGGVINQQAIHHVDALNGLLGPIDAVSATTANRLNRLEAEDTLVAVVRFANGAIGTIEATTAARPDDFEASLSVVGERGTAVVGGIALNAVQLWRFVEPEPGDDDVPRRCSQAVPNGYGLSHGPLLQQVIDALSEGRTDPPVTAEDGVRTTELVHALYRSDEVRGWVRLADRPVSERLGRVQVRQA